MHTQQARLETPTLVVIKVNQLGDNLVFLPGLQEFVRRFPHWRLSILTSPVGRQVFGYVPGSPLLREISGQEFSQLWSSPRRLIEVLRWVREQQPSALMLGVEPTRSAHLLARFSGAPIRVGAQPPKMTIPGSLTHSVPWRDGDPISEINWRVAEALALQLNDLPWSGHSVPPELDLDPANQNLEAASGRIVIHPGASRPYQRWPAAFYVELAERLNRDFPVQLIGSPQDLAQLPPTSCPTVVCQDLTSLIEAVGHSAFFVGNNSGPVHVASALGVPGLVLTGPTHPIWDPAWHQQRLTVVRNPRVSCQPCDRWDRPANQCQNMAAPMVCLNRWTVREVETMVRQKMKVSA